MAKKSSGGSGPPGLQDLLRRIPKVDEFMDWLGPDQAGGARLSKKVVREVVEELRQRILAGEALAVPDFDPDQLLGRFRARMAELLQPNFRPVINCTGVVIHTNLGRSLLPNSAMESLLAAGSRYGNLEFDLATGKRGSRYSLVEELICELTGAEAALVVNNNAAAVLLALDTLARGQEVIVSRGQLVEIGGSFRIPDVMARSGALLKEVGATNRTHLSDYQQAITEETALLLKVHTSNFRMIGFTSEVSLVDLVALGREAGLPVMEDLGSGSLIDLSRFGLPREPTVQEAVATGADVITFSGDKLLGGPQAGIIVGNSEIISGIKENPLNRALRIDKFTLAGLEAILRLYLDEEKVVSEVPTLAMLAQGHDEIKRRASRLVRRLRQELAHQCEVTSQDTESRVGGGAMPEQGLASRAVALRPTTLRLSQLPALLRAGRVPVVGRLEDDRLLLDMRTVADGEVAELAQAIVAVFTAAGQGR
ncbi:MAG: L-seryl-tRNA(Sec) selenium transferase [Thermodesulfobacteriota bacterium]